MIHLFCSFILLISSAAAPPQRMTTKRSEISSFSLSTLVFSSHGWQYRCLGLIPKSLISNPNLLFTSSSSSCSQSQSQSQFLNITSMVDIIMSGTMALFSAQKSKKRGHERHQQKGNMRLITVTVLGSTGPLRFIVKEDDLVTSVIRNALRSYARQRRYPVLGSDFKNFLLNCATSGSEALGPLDPIGSYCCRNFVLCKKQTVENESSGMVDTPPRTTVVSQDSGEGRLQLQGMAQ